MGKALEVAICDDKPEDLVRIRDAFFKCMDSFGENCVKVHLFRDSRTLYEDSCRRLYNLVLLDLEMPGWDGFELAGRLCMESREVKVIFVSWHEEKVFDAFEYMPLWFVRKSRLDMDLYRALQKYFQIMTVKQISFRMKDGFGRREVLLGDILYIECSGHTLTVRMSDKTSYQVYGSLKPMEEELAGYGFLRIHKNYLVNQRYIKEVGVRTVLLREGTELDMGKGRKKQVQETVARYEKGIFGVGV